MPIAAVGRITFAKFILAMVGFIVGIVFSSSAPCLADRMQFGRLEVLLMFGALGR